MKGALIQAENGFEEAVLDLLGKARREGYIDLVLIPLRVPDGDSFAWVLVQDDSLLSRASPLPPVMPVQGARALSSIIRQGDGTKRIAVVMRPCEIRAAIELSKLQQIDLENIILISLDCPGVLPLGDYINDPGKGDVRFRECFEDWKGGSPRPVCKICDQFSMPTSDLHVGILGTKGQVPLIPGSPKGSELLLGLGLAPDKSVVEWEAAVARITKERKATKVKAQEKLRNEIAGPEKLLEVFQSCINCHNCMRVCPVCYCRQCYFDSEALELSPENYLSRAQRRTGLRFPPDTLLFHLGRATHMVTSCVSCGTCEDACPVSIPIAQIFNLLADQAQAVFDYLPGKSIQEPLPLTHYEPDELDEVETPYHRLYTRGGE